MKLLLLTTLLALTHLQVYGEEDYCFGKDTERTQTRHFASKSAYQIVKGTNIDKQHLVPGCEPQRIWILHRHGTRLPGKKVIKKAPHLEDIRDEIVANYRVRRTKPDNNALCQVDLTALQMWKWNSSIKAKQADFLTSQGYDDLRGTAKLYQRYYPEILTREYNNQDFMFRHTDTQRTQESYKAFVEGLFGVNNTAHPESVPDKDLLLRPYDYCEAWLNEDPKAVDSESAAFRRTTLWNNTLSDISRRLGFQYTLDSADIELMWDICRYEQAWQVDRTSVWCSAFLPEQVTVFEYYEDLKYYYKYGYGLDINTRLHCHGVQDMLTHLNSNTKPNVVANFAHSANVQTMITALGISKDDIKLTATNYNDLNDRRWKSSHIDPFAANFVAVKYQCDVDLVDKEKVVFFLNQNAVDLDWCNVGLCNWSEVMKRYAKFYNADCATYYCGDSATTVTESLYSLLLAIIVYLIY